MREPSVLPEKVGTRLTIMITRPNWIGKYYLFTSAMKAGYAWLAVLAVLMSALSLFYYFRIAAAMFFSEGEGAPLRSSYPLTAAVLICAVATVVVGVAPQPFVEILRACVIRTP